MDCFDEAEYTELAVLPHGMNTNKMTDRIPKITAPSKSAPVNAYFSPVGA